MKVKHYLLILLFAVVRAASAQSFVPAGQIGLFSGAKSFSINSAGFIFVSDAAKNEIVKLDTLGNVIRTIGGYGWVQSAFDNPVDIFANTLNVYISDKNNHRIQIFDKDLNFLSAFSTQNSSDERIIFRYPTCAAVSTQGDLFILDSDNKRILKFNLVGEFQVAFGSFDWGKFALSNPKQFVITGSAKILVLDSPVLIMYDQFGNGVRKFQLPFAANNINSTFQLICVNDKSQIAFFAGSNLESGLSSPTIFNPHIEEEILDAFVFNSKLYLLIKNSILIYKIAVGK